jgi:hypothetical protein
MAKAIEDVLHYTNFVRVIEQVKGGVPQDIVPASMMSVTDTTKGNQASYYLTTSTRKNAQLIRYGSGSKLVAVGDATEKPVVLLHTKEHIMHKPDTVMQLIDLNGERQNMGIKTLGRETKKFTMRHMNTRWSCLHSMLGKGWVKWNAQGDIVLDGSVQGTVDYGIPAGNRDQLDILGNGDIISASWNTASTAIEKQIIEIQSQILRLCGYKVTTAYYGKNIPNYIAKNTTMKEYLKNHPGSVDDVRAGLVPQGFAQMNWIPAYNAFFEDKDGNIKDIWGDDQITFTPDPADDSWKGFIEGTTPIPTDIALYGDAVQALNSITEAQGMFGYAEINRDPVTIKQLAGDTFLPYIAVPNAVAIADVTP